MRIIILFFILLLSAILSSCTSSKKNNLVWSDEFKTAGKPDSTKWSYDLGDGCPNLCGWGNNEQQYYTNDANNVRIENGLLIIEARKDSIGGKAFTSTRIHSKHKGDFLYGTIEIKAKLPRGNGTWPAIWMLSSDNKYGGWPHSGEIDIMEHVGHDPGVVHATLHTETFNFGKGTQRENTVTVPDCMDEFHVYSMQWTKDKIDLLVDNKIFHSVTRDGSTDPNVWPFDQAFYLIMNIAVGGNWGGMKGVDESIWPQRMEVDYVRVYN